MKTKNAMKTKWANVKDELGRFAMVLFIGLMTSLFAVIMVFVLCMIAGWLVGVSLY